MHPVLAIPAIDRYQLWQIFRRQKFFYQSPKLHDTVKQQYTPTAYKI